MISKQDVLDRAAEWQLSPTVVEKDYILGWILSAISLHPATKDKWIFKGGTSIKKCYFETYRFSEDLDFSLLPEAPYTEQVIGETLNEVTKQVNELSGIHFPAELTTITARQDKLGRPTFQAKISYMGPMGQVHSLPRIIFDLTNNEKILDEPVRRPILHAYPDKLPVTEGVLTYSLNELLAEKVRALHERTRPRDLYDVVYLTENRREALNFEKLQELFHGKCQTKNIPTPSADALQKQISEDVELVADWEHMLAHQLPTLPNVSDYIGRLRGLIDWIDKKVVPQPVYSGASGGFGNAEETVLNPAGIQYWGGGVPLETIRFAGSNHLLIEFSYHGKHRLVEPYSLRESRAGKILLYAWEVSSRQIKAFHVPEIQNLQSTTQTFNPKYPIELTAHGPIPPISRSSGSITSYNPVRSVIGPITTRRSSRISSGATYIYECPHCGKKFRRKKHDSKLNKHKTKDDWDCPGRTGMYVDTVW